MSKAMSIKLNVTAMLKVRNYNLYIACNTVKFLVEMAKQSKPQSPDTVGFLFSYKKKKVFMTFY